VVHGGFIKSLFGVGLAGRKGWPKEKTFGQMFWTKRLLLSRRGEGVENGQKLYKVLSGKSVYSGQNGWTNTGEITFVHFLCPAISFCFYYSFLLFWTNRQINREIVRKEKKVKKKE
jgi:hypothetical protein